MNGSCPRRTMSPSYYYYFRDEPNIIVDERPRVQFRHNSSVETFFPISQNTSPSKFSATHRRISS